MLLFLSVVFFALCAALVLLVHGAVNLLRIGLGRTGGRVAWIRVLAVFLGAAAVGMYTWGLMAVAGAVAEAEDGGTDSSPLRPCRTPGQPHRAEKVVDYSLGLVPLRFTCERSDGGSYVADSVPDYVNPAVPGLTLATAACAGGAKLDERRRAREDESV